MKGLREREKKKNVVETVILCSFFSLFALSTRYLKVRGFFIELFCDYSYLVFRSVLFIYVGRKQRQ
jgi:hypothetical protein